MPVDSKCTFDEFRNKHRELYENLRNRSLEILVGIPRGVFFWSNSEDDRNRLAIEELLAKDLIKPVVIASEHENMGDITTYILTGGGEKIYKQLINIANY